MDTSSAVVPTDESPGRARPPSIDVGADAAPCVDVDLDESMARMTQSVTDGSFSYATRREHGSAPADGCDTPTTARATRIFAAKSPAQDGSSRANSRSPSSKVSPYGRDSPTLLEQGFRSPGGPPQGKTNSLKSRQSSWTTESDHTPGYLAFTCYYIFLFFAYFFGANSFDHNNDGVFDPEDVQSYLQDKGLLKKNFKRVKKAKDGESSWGSTMVRVLSGRSPHSTGQVRQSTARVSNVSGDYMDQHGQVMSIMQESNENTPGSYVMTVTAGKRKFAGSLSAEGVVVFQIKQKVFKGRVLDGGDIMFSELGRWRRQTTSAPSHGDRVRDAAGSDLPARTSHLRDLFGDAREGLPDVTRALDSMMLSEVQAVPEKGLRHSEESRIFEKVVEQQILPKFVIFQTLTIFLLWLVCAIVEWYQGRVAAPWDALAGLTTFWPETMLGLTGNSCEDYRPQIYRWLLYQFSHKGIMHVTMNAVMIVILGIPLEGSGGTRRMFLLFNLGVIGGAMCYMLGDGHRMVVGASGGVYALLAMHFSNLVLNWRQKKFRKPTLLLLLVLVSADLGSYFMAQGTTNVSGTAHLGGFLTGLLCGMAFGRNYEVQRYEIVLQVVSLILVLAFWMSCITWMALQEDGPRNIFEDHGWCWVRQVMDGTFGQAACVKCGSEECMDYWTNYCATHDTCFGLETVNWVSCTAHGAAWLVQPGAEF